MEILELRHVYYLHRGIPNTSNKFLGCFTTLERLQAAVAEYRTLPGFRDTPEAFVILRRQVQGIVQDGKIYMASFWAETPETDHFEIEFELGLYATPEDARAAEMRFRRDNPDLAEDSRFYRSTQEEHMVPIPLDRPYAWVEGFRVYTWTEAEE